MTTLNGQLSVAINQSSDKHLKKIKQLAKDHAKGDRISEIAYEIGAYDFLVKNGNELMKQALERIQELEKEIQISRSINKINYESN